MDQVCNTIQIQDMIIFHRGFNCRIQTVDRFFTIRIPAYHMKSYPLFNILRLSASGVLFAGGRSTPFCSYYKANIYNSRSDTLRQVRRYY